MKKLLLINVFLLVCLTSGFKINAQCPTTAPVISGPNLVCAGTTVNYNLVFAGPGNLIWSINGGGTLLGGSFNPFNPQVNWVTAGTWRISISTSGCPSTPLGILDVTVVNSPTIPAPTSIAGPAGVCNGSTTVYSVPVVAGQSPIWFIKQAPGAIPGSGTTPPLTPSGSQVSVNWSVQGSYILYASYTNGTCSGMQTTLIINNSTGTAPITLNGNGTDQFCLNQSFNFTAYGDPQDTFTWSLPLGGGTITPSGNSALVQWTSAGTFSIAVTANNPCGASRNASRPATVGPAPTLAPGAISKQNAITCLNLTERFSVPTVPGATSYKWTIGLPAGNYYYTTSVPYLDQTFSSNASATATVIASNGYCDSPPSPIFSFNIGVAPLQFLLPPSVCVGAEITLTLTSTGSMTGYVFAWNVGDGVINGPADGSSIRVKWNSSGQRFVFAVANTPCGAIGAPAPPSFPSPINVQDPSFTLNPITGVSKVCLGSYQYSAPVTQSGITPTWSLTGGGGISNSQYYILVNWNTPGNYTLTANAINSCGTSQSQSLNVTVASGPKPTVSPINGTNSEPVCVSSLPALRNYSVPLTAGNSYLWGTLYSPASTISSSGNSATVTWNQLGNSYVTVTPFTAACSGEQTYLYAPVNLNSSVGVLSSSITSPQCRDTSLPLTLSLTSSTGSITYQVRKKIDNGTWSAWENFYSPTYTIDYTGFPGTPIYDAFYYEFRAVVQNQQCAAVTSNVVPLVFYQKPGIPYSTDFYKQICSGNVTIIPVSIPPAASFSWTSSVTSGTVTRAATSGTGNINDILTSTGGMGRVEYSVTPISANGCAGPVAIYARDVYTIPSLAPNQAKAICTGQSVNYDILVTPDAELNWPDPDGSGPATNAINKLSYQSPDITNTLTNIGSSPTTVTYQVTPFLRINASALGCTGSTSNVVITVNPKPTMTSPLTTVGCGGLPLNLSLTSNVPSSFSWWATNNFYTTGESLSQKNTSIINDIISLDQGTPQNVTYSVYPTSTIGSCIGTTQTVTASIGINQTITFNPLPAKNYGDPAFTLTATASSGLPVSFSSSNPAVATISGNTVTIVGNGATTITASQAGNASYCSPTGVVQMLTVNKINQTITFSPLPPKTPSDPAFTLTATASSGLPVLYTSSIPAVATISGNIVTIVGTGTTTITASQAGNANYNAATSVVQSQIVKINQTITFAALPAKTYGDPAFSLTATASSGLAVTYTSSNTSVATISGNTVTIVRGGSSIITASQSGNVNYNLAPSVTQSLTVSPSLSIVSAGDGHSLVLSCGGGVAATGSNRNGQLGDGTTVNVRKTPVAVVGVSGIISVSAGRDHSLFLKNDGTVWATGRNTNGQLGDGTLVEKIAPIQISSLTGIIAIDAGGAHSLFLKSDGTVWACGLNSSGQLGDGTLTQRTIPVQIAGLTGVIAISGGANHSHFLKNDNRVWATGSNINGQLGDGTSSNRNSPVLLGSISGIISLSAGWSHSLFLKDNGTVLASGSNTAGQLGQGTTTGSNWPVLISGLSAISKVVAGFDQSLFIKNDSSILGCGQGSRLGIGSSTKQLTPVLLTSLSGINAAAGSTHTIFYKNNGTIWATGVGDEGQLGDGLSRAHVVLAPVQMLNVNPCGRVRGPIVQQETREEISTEFKAPIAIYPNPADGELTIELAEDVKEITTITLFDSFGKTMIQSHFNTGGRAINMNTKDLIPGMYFLRMESQQGTIGRKVLVVH